MGRDVIWFNLGALVAIATTLVKIGFLVWVFIRTNKAAAVVYAVYSLLSIILNYTYPLLVSQFVSVDSFAIIGVAIGTVKGLIELGLFIWLILSLTRRSRPAQTSDTVPSTQDV